MSFSTWIVWAIMLMVQNASFTLVSRARNSKSLLYHALAAIGSNGVWFASQIVLVGSLVEILESGDVPLAIFTGLFYVFFTIAGSLTMHWIAIHKIEKAQEE